jgi:hypothetical protein
MSDGVMSGLGHSRRLGHVRDMSGLPKQQAFRIRSALRICAKSGLSMDLPAPPQSRSPTHQTAPCHSDRMQSVPQAREPYAIQSFGAAEIH